MTHEMSNDALMRSPDKNWAVGDREGSEFPAIGRRCFNVTDGVEETGIDDEEIHIDTLVIGSGPSALFLSYLLSGHYPVYDTHSFGPHPDNVLHSKLTRALSSLTSPWPLLMPCTSPSSSAPALTPLYHALDSLESIETLTEHFPHSHMSYSTQALPINVLLDTLARPNGDVDPEPKTRIRWVKSDDFRIPHLVVGSVYPSGGQWNEDPIDTSDDIKTLSYANMLSLPGYTFEDHYQFHHGGEVLPLLTRPTRKEVSSYYSAYPRMVGIEKNILSPACAWKVERAVAGRGFLVRVSYKGNLEAKEQKMVIKCERLVLSSGLFQNVIPPPTILKPLADLPHPSSQKRPCSQCPPLLVFGSGFTAADVILSAPTNQKILHIYKWGIPKRSSPLKACHPQAYPEYASVYKKMKVAASLAKLAGLREEEGKDSLLYEGIPNGEVIDLRPNPNNAIAYIVTIRLSTSHGTEGSNSIIINREVGSMKYCVGRRGDLSYLSVQLQKELGLAPATASPPPKSYPYSDSLQQSPANWVHNMTLREKAERDLEVAKDIFVIGSLTGDSLVKFAGGGIVFASGKLTERFMQRERERREGLADEALGYGIRWSSVAEKLKSAATQPAPRRQANWDINGISSKKVCRRKVDRRASGYADFSVVWGDAP